MKTTRLDLPLLLPELPDEQDACLGRLLTLVGEEEAIERVHVVNEDGGVPALCLHYNPDRATLAEVERWAQAAGAQLTERFGHAVLPIRAIDGEDAARRIENGLRGISGVLAASVSLPAQRARVEFDRTVTSVDAIRAGMGAMGYAASRPAEAHTCCHPREPVAPEAGWIRQNRELVLSLLAGTALVAAWSAERWFGLPRAGAAALYLVSYAFGAFDLLRHAVGTLRRGRFTFDIDLLMLLAAAGAAVLGAWAEGAFLLFLFSLAHALEHYAMGRARHAIRALAELAPPVGRVMRHGAVVEVPVERIGAGETVLVRPAERIPVDGVVRSGFSAVNQAPVTGESMPADKAVGDDVFAGTVNGDGALEITVTRVVGDRTLDRVVRLVEEAQTRKAPTQQFTERFERVFVPAVLVADLLLIVLPPLLGWWTWDTAFYRGMALLVAASPCALALGTPAVVLAGIAQAARHGVLVKGGAHLEELAQVRVIAFDKTGTLTLGRPEVTDLIPAEGVSAAELLCVAAAAERLSQHPLAQAVVRHAEAEGLALPEAHDLESVTARGVRAVVAGRVVEIGSARLWEAAGATLPADLAAELARLEGQARSVMVVRDESRWLGVIGLADRPRPGAHGVLERLRALGVRPLVMLTGDGRGVGEAIGREVGVDEVRAGLLPEEKMLAVRDLLERHGHVAMVGDGVNDAPALAHATIGIAMGGAGTAVALETADVALMADDLGRLPFAVGLARRARAAIQQNLFIALGVIVLLVVATTTGTFGIGPAVVLHEGSTLIVIANALRLLSYDDGAAGWTR